MIAFGCAVTHQSGQPVLLSAERNSDHDIVGLAQRFPNGDKRVVKGSQRGLILPLDMPAKPRRMVVGEGLSDKLALHDAMEHDEDTLVCGRAAKGAGLEEVVRLARRHCVREAVLCLDSDDSHPEAGGMKLGRLLAEEGIATKLVRPPDDKDFRDWWRFPETTREDVQMLIDRTAPLPNKEPYRVYTGTDGLEDVPVPFLIPGLVTRGGLIGIVAPSNGGKTSLVTAMIAAITMKGSKFMGRNTEHGAVLWLVAEGRAAIGPRVHAAYSELGTEKQKARGLARLMRVYDQVPLHDQDAMQSFIATVNRTGQKPLVVVLDTWAALMEGDENDNADTKAALAGCRMMQREWDCALVILQHITQIDGVWVCTRACVVELTRALRAGLVEVAKGRQAADGKQSKAERTYEFVTGTEFRQQIAGLVEPLLALRKGLDRERAAMERIWAAREEEIKAVVGGISGLYGTFQGIVGSTTLVPRV